MRAHRAAEAEAREDLVAALLADAAMAVQRARLRVAVRVRGDRHPRKQEAVALDDVAALARDEAVRRASRRRSTRPSRRCASRSRPRAIRPSGARTIRDAKREGAAIDGDAYSPRGRGPRQRPRIDQRELRGGARPARPRARAPRRDRLATCRRSPRSRSRRRRRRLPSRRDPSTPRMAAPRSCARRTSRRTPRPSAATRSRRRYASGAKVGQGEAVGVGHGASGRRGVGSRAAAFRSRGGVPVDPAEAAKSRGLSPESPPGGKRRCRVACSNAARAAQTRWCCRIATGCRAR